MSITPLCKVRLIGHAASKAAVIADLQELGCLMLLPPVRAGDAAPVNAPGKRLLDALTFLLACPRRRPQIHDATAFNAEQVHAEALDVQRKLLDLEDERDALTQRVRDLAPWGDFEFPKPDDLGGQRLWFYAVPHKSMPLVEALGKTWTLAGRDNANSYVVVVSAEEPVDMPVPRVSSGSVSPPALRRRLEEVEQLIEDAQDQRYSLTRWCDLFVRHMGELQDRAAREEAAGHTLDSDPLFGMEAWSPRDRLDDLRACAKKHGLAMETLDPTDTDEPPTLMRNAPGLDAGEGLVNFYMTPGYWTWDPSAVVLFSFAVFFAMILADAGYAALLGVLLVLIWKRTAGSESGRRTRTLLGLLTGFSLIYGVLVGSYFGVAPAEGSLPAKMVILNVNDAGTMMGLSIVIGVLHLVLANVMNAARFGVSQKALAPLGWTAAIIGGFLLAVSGKARPTLHTAGLVTLALGGLLIFLFSGAGQKPVARIVSGLLAFTKVTSAFGDVLSYLRLFALGLASASLAVAFNDMAGQLRDAVPGAGILLAIIVLLIGHALNMILSLSSAVIHGLRLNVIEFFNWGLPEEGKTFQPFAKKEYHSWNP